MDDYPVTIDVVPFDVIPSYLLRRKAGHAVRGKSFHGRLLSMFPRAQSVGRGHGRAVPREEINERRAGCDDG